LKTLGLFVVTGLGGMAGSMLRYGIQHFIKVAEESSWPWNTFWINLSGSLLIGLLFGLFTKQLQDSEYLRVFLMPGFCGGFTTFSAFSLELLLLLQQSKFLSAGTYAFGSLVFGVGLCFLGYLMGKYLVS
jgi:CrcB protein